MKLSFVSISDIGLVRQLNEDAICCYPEAAQASDFGHLFIVADGMGGTNAGEVASKIATDVVLAEFKANCAGIEGDNARLKFLRDIVILANEEILRQIKLDNNYQGMGTTIVVSWICDNTLYFTWVGDSRIYVHRASRVREDARFHFGQTELRTDDHSMVWDKVIEGEMSPEEARVNSFSHVINKSLGSEGVLIPEVGMTPLDEDDVVLMCSDGLNGLVPDIMISEMIAQHSTEGIEMVSQNLLNAALKNGGDDNISIIVVKVGKLLTASGNNSDTSSLALSTANQLDKLSAAVNSTPSQSRSRVMKKLTIALIALLIPVILFCWYKLRSADETDVSDSAEVALTDSAMAHPLDSIAMDSAISKSVEISEATKKGIYNEAVGKKRDANQSRIESDSTASLESPSRVDSLTNRRSQLVDSLVQIIE